MNAPAPASSRRFRHPPLAPPFEREGKLSRSPLRQGCRDLGDVLALETRAVELVGARLTGAVAAGKRARAIGRAAADLGHDRVAGERIRQADDDHAVMLERDL